MRVYELARALGLPSIDVISRLRTDGEWVDSHLSAVPDPVVSRYIPGRPGHIQPRPLNVTSREQLANSPPSWFPPAASRPAGRPRFKCRPGPSPITMQRRRRDEDDDPMHDLRYEPEITTRDVAQLLDVTQATVRRWVARGYITPVGTFGPSNLFKTDEVLAAHDDIKTRHKATGQARRQSRYGVELRPIDRIRPKHNDAILLIGEAARLINVSPATIRSWIHRGHLIPQTSSKPRAIRLRLGDVITTARSRQLPRRSARPGRSRPRPAD